MATNAANPLLVEAIRDRRRLAFVYKKDDSAMRIIFAQL